MLGNFGFRCDMHCMDKTSIEYYKETLTPGQQKLFKCTSSWNCFKVGFRETQKFIYKATIPATIGDEDIFVETDVVISNISMLLSKASMKKADSQINFEDDSVRMFGQKHQAVLTSSGHHAIPVNGSVRILDDVNRKGAAITLSVTHDVNDKYKTALKLHGKFSHPHTIKLLDLIHKAGMGCDRELVNCIKQVAHNYNVCNLFSRRAPRPVVGLPMANKFNEFGAAMDINFLNGKRSLRLIDHLSRYSAAAIIDSKNSEEIVNKLSQIWISVFGSPR